MKLRDFDFNSLKNPFRLINLAVRMENGPWYEGPTISKTLKMLPLIFADAEIKETRWFFDTFIIELKGETQQ